MPKINVLLHELDLNNLQLFSAAQIAYEVQQIMKQRHSIFGMGDVGWSDDGFTAKHRDYDITLCAMIEESKYGTDVLVQIRLPGERRISGNYVLIS